MTADELRILLAPQATRTQHVEGLFSLGFNQQELFALLDVNEAEIPHISEEKLEEMKEVFGDNREGLIEDGASKEDLEDGVEAYLERKVEANNNFWQARFEDERFLSRRGQRVLQDVAKTAFILMENDANQPRIAAWLTTPHLWLEGKRPVDHIKVDPIQVQAAAHGTLISEVDAPKPGKISDLYGHM